MIHLALQTEYSFKKCYYHLHKVIEDAIARGDSAVGIADLNNTFGHVKFEHACKKAGIKPIFGVRFDCSRDIIKKDSNPANSEIKGWSVNRSHDGLDRIICICRNTIGLHELNALIKKAYDNFYYIPRLTYEDVLGISSNVIVMCEYTASPLLWARVDYQVESPSLTCRKLNFAGIAPAKKDAVMLLSNQYSKVDDKQVYELLSAPKTEAHTYPSHILTESEALLAGISQLAIDNTDLIAKQCEAEISHTGMVKIDSPKTIFQLCLEGAQAKGIDLEEPRYKERFLLEIKLIEEKGYADYFLIVADLIKYAKSISLVGPGRGSSAGSLVCYLMSITEVDPLEYNLLFSRFIDPNRFDLPDIDTDFADQKRKKIIKYLAKKYGQDKVRSLGTVNKLKAKSAIGEFAKGLGIPAWETDEVKDAIIVRSGGDARAAACIMDTFETTESGRAFIKAWPEMKIVERIEDHARHSGKHAAGVVVANDPLTNFGGIDSREDIIQMDKYDAEDLGLLKIDCLGLRTLTILEEAAELAGINPNLFYTLELDDEKTIKLFNDGRLYGIFQFNGQALQAVTKMMGCRDFNDIIDITALARPGSLSSKGTEKFINIRNGLIEPTYFCDAHKKVTEVTHGIIVYQEQMMQIAKDACQMSWKDVASLRKAVSKSLGDEFFATYKDKFVSGAMEYQGMEEDAALEMWRQVSSMGSWSFNKSHAVSYALISYWTGYMKANYPLEFAAATLNNSQSDEEAVKILRDFVVHDKIEYTPVDPDNSGVKWSIVDGRLLGGLTNLHGIGIIKAKKIITEREGDRNFTPSVMNKLLNPETAFDIIFPIEHYFGKIYKKPSDYKIDMRVSKIEEIKELGHYCIICQLMFLDFRDRNDVQAKAKRGGKEVEEDLRYYFSMIVEDDTDSIRCSISPFNFAKLNGHKVMDNFSIKDYVCIMGEMQDAFRSISIRKIVKLDPTKFR